VKEPVYKIVHLLILMDVTTRPVSQKITKKIMT
jgi:hypothetical protein